MPARSVPHYDAGRVGSPERRAALAAAALVIGGLALLRLGFGSFDLWAGSLAVLAGWIVGAAGVIVWLRLPTSRSGVLLLAVASAWGVANLQRTPVDLIDALATVLQFAWAVLLALALLALPDAAWPAPSGSGSWSQRSCPSSRHRRVASPYRRR